METMKGQEIMSSMKALPNKFRERKSTSIPLSVYFFGPRDRHHCPRCPVSKMAPGVWGESCGELRLSHQSLESRVCFAEYS